jgi:TolB protein
VARVDGSDVKRLTNTAAFETAPSWSPNGHTIAFIRDLGDYTAGSLDLFVMDLENGSERQLTQGAFAYSPVWSRDGKTIYVVSALTPGDTRLLRIDLHGQSEEILRLPTDRFLGYSLSPDQETMIFIGGECGDLYSIDLDGSNLTRLTDSQTMKFEPSWSPDGRYVTFAAADDCDINSPEDIFMLDLANGATRKIIDSTVVF